MFKKSVPEVNHLKRKKHDQNRGDNYWICWLASHVAKALLPVQQFRQHYRVVIFFFFC